METLIHQRRHPVVEAANNGFINFSVIIQNEETSLLEVVWAPVAGVQVSGTDLTESETEGVIPYPPR